MIQREPAIAYRAGGRRYFTLRAASFAAARAKLRDNCDCDYCDHPEMPGAPTEHFPCHYHDGSDHANKVMERLARLYMRAFRATKETA